ncbi:hypothetical protein AURDEDRAFT_163614 [Auricularia subglabra TFB-10046 SS5]|nr:hypothetical protein AURDEDRAFT_163614 [Auricularia subglabra TFB-10046 SS5]
MSGNYVGIYITLPVCLSTCSEATSLPSISTTAAVKQQPPLAQLLRQHRKRALSVAGSDDAANAASDNESPGDDKRAYVPSAAGFKRARRMVALSALVQETLRTRDNYLADLKRAKCDLLRDGYASAFPDDLWEPVLADRFIDFGKILSRRFATHVADDNTHRITDSVSVTLGVPCITRSVADQSDWTDAFQDWSAAVGHAYPHRSDELIAYRQFVVDLFRSTHKDEHRRVIAADAAIRCEVANNGSLSFADTLHHRATADRFLSPYGVDASVIAPGSGPGPAPGPAPAAVHRWKPSGQICKNFNSNRCTHPQCRHAHVCEICHNSGHSATDHTAALEEQAAPPPQ